VALKALSTLDVSGRLRANTFRTMTAHALGQFANRSMHIITGHGLGGALAGAKHQYKNNSRNNTQEQDIALTRTP